MTQIVWSKEPLKLFFLKISENMQKFYFKVAAIFNAAC